MSDELLKPIRGKEIGSAVTGAKILDGLCSDGHGLADLLRSRQVSVQRFRSMAVLALRKNRDLLRCTQDSFVIALLQAAELGLEPNSSLGHAYLVPYGKKCSFILGYRGLAELLYRSGDVSTIYADVVREGDTFVVERGTSPSLIHRPTLDDSPATHWYCVVKLRNGDSLFSVMTKAEVQRIRSESKTGSSPAWRNHFDEMAKKCCLRRVAKLMHLSVLDPSYMRGEQIDNESYQPMSMSRTTKEEEKADVLDVNAEPSDDEVWRDAE